MYNLNSEVNTVLIGSFEHVVDPKNRLFIPAKFRSELGHEFILVNGIGKCIFVFSMEQWEVFSGKLTGLPVTNKLAQLFMRKLYASAVEREPDKQGRVLLSPKLKDYAGIEDEAVIIGMGTRVEIWAKSEWENYETSHDEEFEEALESLSELGI